VPIELKESNSFRMNPEDIEKKITDKTRLIIINSPQNPTGSVMTKDELKKTYDIAKKYDLYLYSDEIYARMMYDNTEFHSPSIYDKCNERTIISNGFSKAFAMTGWRLGALIGPETIIERMAALLETTSSCVPPFIQKAGIEAIKGDQTPAKKMYNEFKQRRDILVDGLNSIRGISCVKPSGAFYVFANIKDTNMSSEEFANYILEDASVAVLPGTDFGKFGEGYIRLCYATTQTNILEALKRIKTSLGQISM
jgi:aspartate/methionine/tyrosine aminotransferase